MKKKISITILILIGLTLILSFLFKKPSSQGPWSPDVAIQANITLEQDEFTVNNLRDWSYENGEITNQAYISETYRFDDILKTHYVIQHFDRLKLTAHTLLVFEFDDGKEIGFSIEARKEKDEEYSAIRGVFKAYELIHVWGTGNDLKSRRTDLYQESIETYQIAITQLQQQEILRSFLKETQKLIESPGFYNTLLNNCTNLLAKQINTISPSAIPYHYSFILTGRSVNYLKKLGYIK